MNLGDLTTDLKNLIGPAVEVDDNGLKQWLNDAYMKASNRISDAQEDYYGTSSTASIVANQQEYDLPSDFRKMVNVNIKSGSQWYRAVPFNNIGQIPVANRTDSNQGFSASDPHYYIYGDKLGTMPIYDTAVANGIKIWYIKRPTLMSQSTDSPDLPNEFHYLLKYDAYANYLDQDDEHASADRYRLRFEQGLDKMVEMIKSRVVDEPKGVQISHDADLYGGEGHAYWHFQS